MGLFESSQVPETEASIRAKLISYAQAAGLQVTSWLVGSVGQQILETMVAGLYGYTQTVPTIVRGFASLDTATDPGDVDPYDDTNVALTPAPGFLSNMGANVYGTTRNEASNASGFVTFTNAGVVPRTFAPYGLIFTRSYGSPAPTYTNTPDAAIYTGVGGTVTVAAGSSLTIPVAAISPGSANSATIGSLSLTTSLLGCSATNAAAVLGTDREGADAYRARCRTAPARTSLGGPGAAISYLAATQYDGTPVINGSGTASNITRVYVSSDSTTGIVDAYYASPTGPATAEDVTAANLNITSYAYATPDAITFTGVAATATTIVCSGTVKIKARPGLVVATIKQAIVDTLVDYFSTIPIGGVDQVAGAGVVYAADMQAVIRTAYVGLYDPILTSPAGASTAIALGHVPVLSTSTASWTVTVV